MPVIQISKVIHCLGTSGELPDRLELGQLGMTTDTADVLIGAAGLPQVAGRKSYPYQNLKILTELDVQKTMTGDVYHAGPLYSQELISETGVMDVPLFKRNVIMAAQYGTYDYSFTSSLTSQMGIIHVALNGATPHVTATVHVWGLVDEDTFSFSTLLVDDQVLLRVSWTPADLGEEIYKFHMAGREWNAMVDATPDVPPIPKPLPTTIIDLAALAMSPTTVQLTYTNAEGAIAHEYRLNGGAVNPVPGGKLIAGLNPSTMYNFEVRGVNANGNGAWSNVAAATTPGVVQSYPDSYVVVQGKVLTVTAPGVLQNDTNAFGLAQTAEIVSNPTNGTLTLNPNGGFVYTPFTVFTGTDSFTYRAWDGTRYGDPATVTLTVTANPVPVGVNNNYTMNENTVLVTNTTTGILVNDTDANGDTLTASLVSNVTHGTLSLNPNGTFTYTPTASFVGVDTFVYRAFDGVSYSANTTVTITVNDVAAPNATPSASANSYVVNQDAILNVASPGVLVGDTDADGDTLTASLVSGPSHGVLTLNANGSFTYNPTDTYSGPDTFVYRAFDGQAYSNNATVTITVNAVVANTAPVAAGNSYSVEEDAILSVSAPGVLGNDTDVNGDTLSAILVSNVTHGALTLNANGSFTYVPAANYHGNDSFTYKASDGALNSNTVTVNISVTPKPDPDSRQAIPDGYVTNVNPFSTNAGTSWGLYPDGKIKTGQSVTPSTIIGNWLVNTIDGVVNDPGAFEVRISTSNTYAGIGGSARGVWHNLATARYMSLQLQTAINMTVNFTVEIRAAGTTTILDSAVVILECFGAGGGGGGGGGGGCVTVGTILPGYASAGEVEVGDYLHLANPTTHEERMGQVTYARPELQFCYRLETARGVVLECSNTAPIATLDGHFVQPRNAFGAGVPVRINGEWIEDVVISVTELGEMMVMKISCENDWFLAGANEDMYFLHHNEFENKV